MLVQKFKGIDSENLFTSWGTTNVAIGNIKFQQDIKHLLETPLGSVVGNLDYGSNLYQLLYLPVNDALGTMIQEEIRNCIEKNYSDILVEEVEVYFEGRTVQVKIGINNNNSNILEYINIGLDKEVDD